MTDFLLCYDEQAEIVRDPRRVDQQLKPDAELKFNNNDRFFYMEFDTGSEDLATVEKQFRAYRYVRDFLIVVTLADVRMRHLMERAESIKEIVLFATLEDVLNDPHGPVYRDCFGNMASL